MSQQGKTLYLLIETASLGHDVTVYNRTDLRQTVEWLLEQCPERGDEIDAWDGVQDLDFGGAVHVRVLDIRQL